MATFRPPASPAGPTGAAMNAPRSRLEPVLSSALFHVLRWCFGDRCPSQASIGCHSRASVSAQTRQIRNLRSVNTCSRERVSKIQEVKFPANKPDIPCCIPGRVSGAVHPKSLAPRCKSRIAPERLPMCVVQGPAGLWCCGRSRAQHLHGGPRALQKGNVCWRFLNYSDHEHDLYADSLNSRVSH
ncbi:hypothetical protein B0J11DRAFT_283701 [Dendryphion nanum]|uniref:Uncharacterized protein n=1 Tax=Dendryphion nanum TaxID=256645 RepID=A0A9P9DX61_9PLEO|nr:hypothetical protein B0J11DRAFT_283701 [Dendryphion nanum]